MAKQKFFIGYDKNSRTYTLNDGTNMHQGLTQSQLMKRVKQYRSNSIIDFDADIPRNVIGSVYERLTRHR